MAQQAHPTHSLILYDGVCGLCNGFVRFVLARDPTEHFLFAPLQSDLGRALMARHGRNPDQLDTFYVLPGHPEASDILLPKSQAVVFVGRRLHFPWNALALGFACLPGFLRDILYNGIARTRYRIFGKLDSCPVPAPSVRKRFLE